MKALLVSVLVATVAIAALASRRRGPKAAVATAVGLFAAFMMAYLVFLFVYPVFDGR